MTINEETMDSKSDTSDSEIFDPKNEDGWEDMDNDEEEIKFVSLFDDRTFTDAKNMLIYCKDKFGFDIWNLKQKFGELIDLESTFRLTIQT